VDKVHISETRTFTPEEIRRMFPAKAFAYMRCSGLGQVDGDTWDRQGDAIEGFAREQGFMVAKVYRDEGVSGTRELENRPGLSEMLADLMDSPEVQTIIIEKLDRLARDVIVQENIIRMLELRNINLRSASPAERDLCSNDPTRKFIRVILGASAQLEKDLIIMRTRAARERIRKNGERCEGRKPFGRDEDEQGALAYMVSLRSARVSYVEIARRLNTKGYKTREGKRWHAATIRKILARETRG